MRAAAQVHDKPPGGRLESCNLRVGGKAETRREPVFRPFRAPAQVISYQGFAALHPWLSICCPCRGNGTLSVSTTPGTGICWNVSLPSGAGPEGYYDGKPGPEGL